MFNNSFRAYQRLYRIIKPYSKQIIEDQITDKIQNDVNLQPSDGTNRLMSVISAQRSKPELVSQLFQLMLQFRQKQQPNNSFRKSNQTFFRRHTPIQEDKRLDSSSFRTKKSLRNN